MLPMLRDRGAPESHTVQYFEIMGNRGIYHQGWTAVTKHRTPWLTDAPPLADDATATPTHPTRTRNERAHRL
jgi:arylsulfatase A-like enzyme